MEQALIHRVLLSIILLLAPVQTQQIVVNTPAPVSGSTSFTIVERLSIGQASCSSGLTRTFGTATTAGEGIFIYYFAGLAGGAVTISDSGSESYTKDWELTSVGSHAAIGFARVLGSAAGITFITITGSGDGDCFFVVEHVKRSSGTWSRDQLGAASATGVATPWQSPAVTTTAASEILFGGSAAYEQSAGSCVMSTSSPWTGTAVTDGANGNALIMMDQLVSSVQTGIRATGSTSTCTTLGGAGNYPGIVTFE